MLSLNSITVNRSAGDTIMNAGKQNMAVDQPNKVLSAGNTRYINLVCQFISGKFHFLVGVYPLAQRAQGLRRQTFRQASAILLTGGAAVNELVEL